MSVLAAPTLTSDSLSASRGGGIAAEDLAELVRAFTDVTERLQATHATLEAQVGQLKSELAEANEQLRRSRELAALGEMAAGIAHEIRNPLGSIALDVEVLREECTERTAPRAICERVLRAVGRLDSIVGDVLRFARDLRVQATIVSTSEVFDAAIECCRAEIVGASIEIERVVTEGEAALDRNLMTQAVVNLVRNAVEAMRDCPGPRTLRLGARRAKRAVRDGCRADHVIFRVEDSGPGIPQDMLERIFHPFFTTRNEGTGLGLAIVHRIVDAHGGSIAVRNTGTGARFEIALPARVEDRRPAARPGLQEAVRRRIGPLAG